jgi:hypothetical protein
MDTSKYVSMLAYYLPKGVLNDNFNEVQLEKKASEATW